MSMVNGEYQLDKERYDRFLNGDVKGFEELVIEYKNLLIFLNILWNLSKVTK